jgi:rare lipoprotein A
LWSKFQQWATALACGLFLLSGSPGVMAANTKPAGKPVASTKSKSGKPPEKTSKSANKSANKPAKSSAKKSAARTSTTPEFGVAEMIDSGSVGLRGKASYYGTGFQGRKTSTGERFDVRQFTAASNHFPLGSLVAVRRVDIDRCAIVKVNDRMHAKHRQRVIDVSRSVAEYLDMLRAGVVFVSVAPITARSKQQGLAACQAAFDAEVAMPDYGAMPPRFPGFEIEARPAAD